MTAEQHVCSTADYCESADSSTRHCLQYHSHRKLPHYPICRRKQYRFPSNACHHYVKPNHSVPRKFHRTCGRRRKTRTVEDSTSVDDRKSYTSYSSVLTVDVRREMEAVNRDIEEIIRRCDDYCTEPDNTTCPACCAHRTNKSNKTLCSLTQEQLHILSMKKPPLNKLKDIPLSMLKPRPPKHSSLNISANMYPKFKTSRDIRHIVEETDDILRNVCKDLARGKHQQKVKEDESTCVCDAPSGCKGQRPASCLERYLGTQNKCRRIYENRRLRAKWRDLFERGNNYLKRPVEKRSHVHDTNCISEPRTSACLVTVKLPAEPSKPVLIDAGVNTDSHETKSYTEIIKFDSPIEANNDILHKDSFLRVDSSNNEKNTVLSFGCMAALSNTCFPLENSSSKSIVLKHTGTNKLKSLIDHYDSRSNNRLDGKEKQMSESLLLDRNMGLSLDKKPENDAKSDRMGSLVKKNSVDQWLDHDIRPVIPPPSPEKYVTRFEDCLGFGSKRRDAGDFEQSKEPSKYVISHIIDKICNNSGDWSVNSTQTVDAGGYDPIDCEAGELDSWTCLEIMRRLVVILSRSHLNISETYEDVPAQYSRVRKMKLDHLLSIEKEIHSIKDLEFYLKNASPARSTTLA